MCARVRVVVNAEIFFSVGVMGKNYFPPERKIKEKDRQDLNPLISLTKFKSYHLSYILRLKHYYFH